MVKEDCRHFRRAFEPGRRGDHLAACAVCRAWAREIESLRSFGVDLPLPQTLRDRLCALRAKTPEIGDSACSERLPQVPFPAALAVKLRRIPLESRRQGGRIQPLPRSGEMIAASLLFAILLTLGLARPASSANRPNLATVVLKEVGNGWSKPLVAASEYILDGCLTANSSFERALGRFVAEEPDEAVRPRERGASQNTPETATPSKRKENHDGNGPSR